MVLPEFKMNIKGSRMSGAYNFFLRLFSSTVSVCGCSPSRAWDLTFASWHTL